MSLFSFLNVIMMVLVFMAIGVLCWFIGTFSMYRAIARAKSLPLDVFMVNKLVGREFLYRMLIVFGAIGVLLAAFIIQPTV